MPLQIIDMNGFINKHGVKVLTKSKRKGSETYWICECPVCHRQDWEIRGSVLRNKDNTPKMCKYCSSLNNLKKIKKPFFKDLTGQKFGLLTAIEPTEQRYDTSVIWKCICDCGNVCYVPSEFLHSGDRKSCGCLSNSYKEKQIEKILKENNLIYEKEKIFFNKYRFDFFVNNCYIIEYDGRQHFIYEKNGFGKNLEEIRKRDLIKNNYCFENNIPIIRIPFYYKKEINIEDLKLETTKFLLTKENENEYYQYL